jgi:hypothetical protein
MSKWIVCLLLIVTLGGSRFADAQQPQRVPQIEYVSIGDSKNLSYRSEAFRARTTGSRLC